MNILILYKDSMKGGVVNNTETIVLGLQKRGIKCIVAGNEGPGTSVISKNIDVKIINFTFHNLIKNYKQITRIIKENNIDIIHCQNRLPAIIASIYCFFHKNVKYIWSNHQYPIPCDLFHKLFTKYGNCAITSSIEGEQMLHKSFNIEKSKIKRVNLGCDIDFFVKNSKEKQIELRKKLDIKENEKVIFLYGRLVPIKGHIFFLNAIAKAKTSVPFKIIFPGEGEKSYIDEILSIASKNNIQDKIIFPGFVDGKDYLSISDLVILPSIKEGFPIACIETFSMGIPLIRTKTGGYADTQDYCSGVDYGDTITLANLLTDFFTNKSFFQEKAKAAYQKRPYWGYDRMVEDYLKIYKSVTDKE
mgnify:CR=1 FL=1